MLLTKKEKIYNINMKNQKKEERNMNVYNTANKLAEELKNSEEYINFKMAKQYINLNPDLKEKIDNFEKIRYEEQIKLINTGKQEEEQLRKVQAVYEELIEIEEVKKYFDAELKFNILLADVNKIITESVKDVLIN